MPEYHRAHDPLHPGSTMLVTSELRGYLAIMACWKPATLSDHDMLSRRRTFNYLEPLLREQLGEPYVEWARARCFPEPR